MNVEQIESVLKSNPYTKYKFGGVFNNDNLPINFVSRKFYVVNSSADVTIMGHWVVFIYYNMKMYFIDSLGRLPEHYGGNIKRYYEMCHFTKSCLITRQIQSSTSLVCGAYTIVHV